MTISKVSNWCLLGVAADTKPTTYAAKTIFIETDSGVISQFDGSVWQVIVSAGKTETLTNKTLTAPIISTISNSGTLTLPAGAQTLVGRTTTDTLTNKTLTAPVISTITNSSNTLTLPTTACNIVGDTTSNTLTGKTISASSNTISNIADTNIVSGAAIAWSKISKASSALNDLANLNATSPSNNDVLTYNTSSSKWINQVPPTISPQDFWGMPQKGSYGFALSDPFPSLTFFGTLARQATITVPTLGADLLATEGIYVIYNIAASNSGCGQKNNTTTHWITMDQNPICEFRVRLWDTANICRFLFGLMQTVAVPTSDTLVTTSTPCAFFGFRTTDTNMQLVTSSGGGTVTYTDTGIAIPSTMPSTFSTWKITLTNAGVVTAYNNGTQVAQVSTNTPTTGQGLSLNGFMTCSSSTSQTFHFHWYSLTKDF